MSTDIRKRDYLSYIEEYLPQQFDNAENTKQLLSILLSASQEFQDELEKLFNTGLDVDTATGYQLEILGKLSGLERTSTDDEIYRADIKFKQTVDNSSGTTPEVLSFAKNITGVDDVIIIPNYPAAFITQVQGGDEVLLDIANRIDDISAAGVNAHSVIHLERGYGIVPCETDDLYYPAYNGAGENLMQAGEPTALSTALLFKTDFIAEGELNWRSVLPEMSEVYSVYNGAGEPLMQAGEPEAYAKEYTLKDVFFTRGRVSETYTSRNYI